LHDKTLYIGLFIVWFISENTEPKSKYEHVTQKGGKHGLDHSTGQCHNPETKV